MKSKIVKRLLSIVTVVGLITINALSVSAATNNDAVNSDKVFIGSNGEIITVSFFTISAEEMDAVHADGIAISPKATATIFDDTKSLTSTR